MPVVLFSRLTYTVTEGGDANATVILSNPSAFSVTVDYATGDGTAKQPTDYATNTGTLIFAPGETSKRFMVKTVDDTFNEDDKTINLALNNANNASLSKQGTAAMLTIIDNDPLPTIQFSAANYTVAENDGKATIQITLSAPSGRAVHVHYRTSDGSAVNGVDYGGLDASLAISSGQTSATFAITIINDNWSEPEKTVNLLLDTPVNAVLSVVTQATLTIHDDDRLPTIQFSHATYTVTEGSTAIITVTLSNPSASLVTVNYATSNGTAITGQDYTATSGILIFAPGELSRSFSVPILQDNLHEPNKTVNLTLNSSTNGTLGATATMLLIILDDDPASTNSAVYLPMIRH